MTIRGANKYRPYFTGPELAEIISALKEKPTPSRLPIIRYLESYSLKINHGIVTPSHTMEPTIEEKLGFSPDKRYTQLSEQEIYEKHRLTPTSCNPKEISIALDYAYRNRLMDPQQEKEYEISQLGR